VKYGGRTPVAAIVHALTLLLITLFAGGWAEHIPFATLGAILVVTAYRMSEWRSFVAEFRAPKSDLFVLLTTFILTVAVDLTVAVQVGVVLAAFLFMRRMSEVTNVREIAGGFDDETDDLFSTDPQAVAHRDIPAGVQVYEIDGPFFFGAAEMFKERVQLVAGRPRVLILRMRNVPAIDSTGLHALRQLVERSRGDGVRVILSTVHTQPMAALERSGLLALIGEEHLFEDLDDALAAARQSLVA
jgi:SulP family sulfate permease